MNFEKIQKSLEESHYKIEEEILTELNTVIRSIEK